jgi:hypothetical protein
MESVMAATRDGGQLMRGQARRAALVAPEGQAVGRHERRRRPHLVEVAGHPRPARRATRTAQAEGVRATRATRSRHAARPGWASWVEQARRVAGQAREWWAEGAERVAVRARERWTEQAANAQRSPAGGRVAAARPGAGPARSRPAGPGPRHLAVAPEVRRASWREDLVTGWCSLLLVLGLYLDGWNHINLVEQGSFLTPWHGVLYLGFAATAAWILTRHQRRGAWSLRAVPPGYRLALVGVALAMVAVAGDAVWHTLYGEAQGLARLVSPFHLVLFTGACLLVSSALRAAWSGPTPARVAGLRAFWPVVLSTTLVVAMTAFFFQYVSPVVAWRRPGLDGLPAGSPFAETVQVYELLGLLVHNLFFVAPVLLLLLRWQTPLGTFTVMAGSVALLLATQTEFGLVGLVGAAVLGGAAADVAVTLLRPSPQRRWAARAVAVVAPAVYWTSHFALLKAGYGVSWELEMWLGSVVWASLSGLTLALLMWPPAVPLTAWNRGRSAAARASATPTPTSMPARMVGR